MTTVSGTLSADGVSSVLQLRNQVEQVTWSLATTFGSGSAYLQRATSPAATAWENVKGPFTVAANGVYETRPNEQLRFYLTGSTSPSLDYSMADGDALLTEFRDSNNERKEYRSQAGKRFEGTLSVGGAVTLDSTLAVTGALSLTAAPSLAAAPFVTQAAPTAKTVSATLTAAQLLARLITGNQGGAGAAAYTLPLGTDMELARTWAANDSFDFTVINLSTVDAEDITLTANTGFTIVGNPLAVAYSTAGFISSATFRVRRSAADTFIAYRL